MNTNNKIIKSRELSLNSVEGFDLMRLSPSPPRLWGVTPTWPPPALQSALTGMCLCGQGVEVACRREIHHSSGTSCSVNAPSSCGRVFNEENVSAAAFQPVKSVQRPRGVCRMDGWMNGAFGSLSRAALRGRVTRKPDDGGETRRDARHAADYQQDIKNSECFYVDSICDLWPLCRWLFVTSVVPAAEDASSVTSSPTNQDVV